LNQRAGSYVLVSAGPLMAEGGKRTTPNGAGGGQQPRLDQDGHQGFPIADAEV
jgi:hypothetical protein